MTDPILSIFYENDFHDLPLLSLAFQFEEQKCVLTMLENKAGTDEMLPLMLEFEGVYRFTSEYPTELVFAPCGCDRATCQQIDETHYQVDFLFELANNHLVWNVSLGFANLILQRLEENKVVLEKEIE